MAIYRILKQSSFRPSDVERMTSAYEDTLRFLGVVDRNNPVTEIIARKIIEVAQSGELDALAIRTRAIEQLGIPSRPL